MEIEDGKTELSSSVVSIERRGTRIIPPPAPKSPFTEPARIPAIAIYRRFLDKKTPPEERVSKGGVFMHDYQAALSTISVAR